MYSILLKDNNKWKFLTIEDGTDYQTETLEKAQEKIKELLKTISLDSVLVVKRCTINSDITISEPAIEKDNAQENEAKENETKVN